MSWKANFRVKFSTNTYLVAEHRGHDFTRESLAQPDNAILRPWRYFIDNLGQRYLLSD
jgi:hypothetical protein